MDSETERGPDVGTPVHALPEDLAPELSEIELVADIWAADAREARYVAERAVSITRFARRRRRERLQEFGPRGGPGLDSRYRQPAFLADFSETLVPELALLRHCSEFEAERVLVESLILTTSLPGTWSALYEGRIDVPKMRALVDLLGTAKPAAIAEIEATVLPDASRLTVPQLRLRVRRSLARLDVAALEARRTERARQADVTHQPTGDGMGRVIIDLPVWKAAACVDSVRQLADQQRSGGDTRPIGVIRSDIACDMMLRPWDTSRPPVTALLTIHAPLPALSPAEMGTPQPPAEVSGEIVTAAQCRELLEQLDMLGVRSAPAGGAVQLAVSDPGTGRLIAVGTRSELTRAAGRSRKRTRRRAAPERPARPGEARNDDGPGLRPTPSDTRVPDDSRSATLRPRARQALPLARLPAGSGSMRHRPRRGPCRGRADRLLEPLLSLPTSPPDQDVRSRLALRTACRRIGGRPHPERSLPDLPTTRLVRGSGTRPAMARGNGSSRPAALLTRCPAERASAPAAPDHAPQTAGRR